MSQEHILLREPSVLLDLLNRIPPIQLGTWNKWAVDAEMSWSARTIIREQLLAGGRPAVGQQAPL